MKWQIRLRQRWPTSFILVRFFLLIFRGEKLLKTRHNNSNNSASNNNSSNNNNNNNCIYYNTVEYEEIKTSVSESVAAKIIAEAEAAGAISRNEKINYSKWTW